jgi:hypothetical protein
VPKQDPPKPLPDQACHNLIDIDDRIAQQLLSDLDES